MEKNKRQKMDYLEAELRRMEEFMGKHLHCKTWDDLDDDAQDEITLINSGLWERRRNGTPEQERRFDVYMEWNLSLGGFDN